MSRSLQRGRGEQYSLLEALHVVQLLSAQAAPPQLPHCLPPTTRGGPSIILLFLAPAHLHKYIVERWLDSCP